jgi:hypothetical protein
MLLVTALIVMSSEPVKGADSINWALFRPAFQSTTYTLDSTPLDANFAVDDQRNAKLGATKACAHTQAGSGLLKSWWAVDFGLQINVSHVILIGRNDESAERLADLNVGTTNTDPRIVAPLNGLLNIVTTPPPGTFSLCAYKGQYTDYRLDLSCNSGILPGRYLIVQYKNASNYLALCEVQAFGIPSI